MTDWEALEKQLKSLGVAFGKNSELKSKPKKQYPIETVVEGRFIDTQDGQVFCHTEHYPINYCHGRQMLYPEDSIHVLCRWAGAEGLSNTDISDFIFLDTETSGLAGGTGTYAFEVGLGRFVNNEFRLAQFFMRHPGEEPALLDGLSEFMHGMKAVVTYNGKSFDIPLLNTRYTMMGMSSPFEDIHHFDLLPLARRLWRLRLESRTLGHVESEILGVERGDEEVPGYLIPELYFDFLKSQDARPLAGIFYHNAIDILSLAGLLSHAAFLLHNPTTDKVKYGEDHISLARFFSAQNDQKLAEELFCKALASDLKDDLYWDVVAQLSFLYKKQEKWHPAIKLWEQAAEYNQIYAFVELAKYYEHRVKDLHAAQHWTLKAITALEKTNIPTYQYVDWQERLNHRLNRLNRRLLSHTNS
jgi:uncharacterized protein